MALSLILAGCGGAAAVSFAARANAICASALRQLRSLPPPGLTAGAGQPRSPAGHSPTSRSPARRSPARHSPTSRSPAGRSPAGRPAGDGALASYLQRAVPIVQAEARAILALPRPAVGARRRRLLDRYLRALAAELAGYRGLLAAAASGDPGALTRAEATLASSDAGSLAAAYGMLSCGAPGATIT